MEWLKERWAVILQDRRVEMCSGNHVLHSGSQGFLFLSVFCCSLMACLCLKMFVHLVATRLRKGRKKMGEASGKRKVSNVLDLMQVDSLSIS